MEQIINAYSTIKNKSFIGRYFLYDLVLEEIEKLSFEVIHRKIVGYSVLGKPIVQLSIGKGDYTILIWSQMHGNESTTTKAIFDFLSLLQLQPLLTQDILTKASIHIIPVLNPDGMDTYTRENANGVDLNRDALLCNEPESLILRAIVDKLQPDFCFNMHGQRTIFSAGFNSKPATLSFLSPSINEERSVTSIRKKVMQLVVDINETLQLLIPGQVGRYDDGFNLNCTGDYFQRMGYPVVLFESGHYANDYEREKVRMYTFIALYKGILSLVNHQFTCIDHKKYFEIPQNKSLFFDVLIRNVKIKQTIVSLAIQYKETLVDGKFQLIPLIAQVNELDAFWGHQEIDAHGNEVMYENKVLKEIPLLGTIIDLVKFNIL